jgi:hypothetical protein
MIGGGRALLFEEAPPRPERGDIALPACCVLARHGSQLCEVRAEPGELRIDHCVWTEGRDHAPLPSRASDRCVGLEGIERAVRGGNQLDLEAFVKGTRPEFFGGEMF